MDARRRKHGAKSVDLRILMSRISSSSRMDSGEVQRWALQHEDLAALLQIQGAAAASLANMNHKLLKGHVSARQDDERVSLRLLDATEMSE